jgi:hypothetical protein
MPPSPRGVEPLRTFPKRIEAACYNRARLALHRIAKPLRLALSEHRGLEVILDDDCWLVVDTLNNDQLILAWTQFEQHRSALHEPVACVLHLYHVHAGLVMGTALEDLDRALTEQLNLEH